MSDYKTRVTIEYDELVDKLEKLDRFFDTETFAALSVDERNLLHRQLDVMCTYAEILDERMNAWGHNER